MQTGGQLLYPGHFIRKYLSVETWSGCTIFFRSTPAYRILTRCPEYDVDPMVYLEIYKNGVLLKEIILTLTGPYMIG
jgi:hypothetical protein